MRRFDLGDTVVIRSVFRGNVRWAYAWRIVADDGAAIVTYLCPGTGGVWTPRDADGRYIERWVRGDPPAAATWHTLNVLSLVRRGDAHAIWLLWDEAWTFRGWYVQLQSPLVDTRIGFDTTDHALDITVDPAGRWNWKDEEDFAEAIALGAFDADEVAAIRAEGERVVAARPWPTGWEDWRPPAEWSPLELPEAWDVV